MKIRQALGRAMPPGHLGIAGDRHLLSHGNRMELTAVVAAPSKEATASPLLGHANMVICDAALEEVVPGSFGGSARGSDDFGKWAPGGQGQTGVLAMGRQSGAGIPPIHLSIRKWRVSNRRAVIAHIARRLAGFASWRKSTVPRESTRQFVATSRLDREGRQGSNQRAL